MDWIYLSHELSETTPAYGNGRSLVREKEKEMEKADSCNTQVWHLSNHLGTHVDGPRHFSVSGTFLDQYPAQFWICTRVCHRMMQSVAPDGIITPDHPALQDIPADTDLLLIQTGFWKNRGQTAYVFNNPGFDPDLADDLRSRVPALKMVGFDSISLTGFSARDLGRKAHQAFLDHDRPILIIEDMDLSGLGKKSMIHQVIVGPVRVKNSDAAPCTVIAGIHRMINEPDRNK
jgi:kynurenine formamidase